MVYLSPVLGFIAIYTGYVYCQLTLLESSSDIFNINGTKRPFSEIGVGHDGLTTTYIRDLGDDAFETLIVSASGFVELKSKEPPGSPLSGFISVGCELVASTAVICHGSSFSTTGHPFTLKLAATTEPSQSAGSTSSGSSFSSNVTPMNSPSSIPSSSFPSTATSTGGPTSAPQSVASNESSSKASPKIIGCVAVGVFLLCLIPLTAYWMVRRRRKGQNIERNISPFVPPSSRSGPVMRSLPKTRRFSEGLTTSIASSSSGLKKAAMRQLMGARDRDTVFSSEAFSGVQSGSGLEGTTLVEQSLMNEVERVRRIERGANYLPNNESHV